MLPYIQKAPNVTEERERELFSFAKSIGVALKDARLFNLALTHTSYANETRGGSDSNERLEFLGDSILGMVTAEYIFSSFTTYHEGTFSKIKAVVVSEESLAEVARTIGLGRYIRVGRGEMSQGGNLKKAILADAMEAVIAAIYLDQGLDEAKRFVLSFIPGQISKLLENKISYKDYKTKLQEYLQKRRGKVPVYAVVGESGPDHEHVFSVTVQLGTKVYGPADGKTKKAAEQGAAKLALIDLGLEQA